MYREMLNRYERSVQQEWGSDEAHLVPIVGQRIKRRRGRPRVLCDFMGVAIFTPAEWASLLDELRAIYQAIGWWCERTFQVEGNYVYRDNHIQHTRLALDLATNQTERIHPPPLTDQRPSPEHLERMASLHTQLSFHTLSTRGRAWYYVPTPSTRGAYAPIEDPRALRTALLYRLVDMF